MTGGQTLSSGCLSERRLVICEAFWMFGGEALLPPKSKEAFSAVHFLGVSDAVSNGSGVPVCLIDHLTTRLSKALTWEHELA